MGIRELIYLPEQFVNKQISRYIFCKILYIGEFYEKNNFAQNSFSCNLLEWSLFNDN